jgi:hypothetical protein
MRRNAGHNTHLAVDRSFSIETDECKDYGNEDGQTRKRVNLHKYQISQRLTLSVGNGVLRRVHQYRPILSAGKDDALG